MASGDYFACPSCDKRYRFKAELARKKVRCADCGAKMRAPAAGGMRAELLDEHAGGPPTARPTRPMPRAPSPRQRPAPADGGYELNDMNDLLNMPVAPPGGDAGGSPGAAGGSGASGTASAGHGGAGKCPSCNQKIKPGAVICINCGFNLQAGRKLKTRVLDDDAPAPGTAAAAPPPAAATANPLAGDALTKANRRAQYDADVAADTQWRHRVENLYGPLGIIAVAAVLLIVNALVLAPISQDAAIGTPAYALGSVIYAAVRFIVQFPILFVIIFVVAKVFSSSYGPILTVLLKLAAIALFVGMFGDTLGYGLDIITQGGGGFAFIIRLTLVYAAFHTLAAWLLEMDPTEAVVSFVLLLILPFVALIFVGAVILSMFM
jgi:hypothetical protein